MFQRAKIIFISLIWEMSSFLTASLVSQSHKPSVSSVQTWSENINHLCKFVTNKFRNMLWFPFENIDINHKPFLNLLSKPRPQKLHLLYNYFKFIMLWYIVTHIQHSNLFFLNVNHSICSNSYHVLIWHQSCCTSKNFIIIISIKKKIYHYATPNLWDGGGIGTEERFSWNCWRFLIIEIFFSKKFYGAPNKHELSLF